MLSSFLLSSMQKYTQLQPQSIFFHCDADFINHTSSFHKQYLKHSGMWFKFSH
jgi:hypothetical protein